MTDEQKKTQSELLVDYVLTDVRKAFEILVAHGSIRVTLFIRQPLQEGEDDLAVMRSVQTSKFRGASFAITQFARGTGLCGCAWKKGEPACGNSYILYPFKKDPRFHSFGSKDNNMSFFCSPIWSEHYKSGTVIGVLSIDSLRSRDFKLDYDDMTEVDAALGLVRQILADHILHGRFDKSRLNDHINSR